MNKIRSKTKRKKQVQAPCRRPSIDLVILFLTIAADHFKSRSKDYGEGMEGT